MTNIILQILSDGRIRFKRGSKEHNESMIRILSNIVDDPKVIEELTEFFKGSEEIELLVGDTILCG